MSENNITIVSNGVGTEHPKFKEYKTEWRTISDCMAGQRAIKKAKTRYLPKPESWSMERYEAYLLRAHFLNATYRTAVGMTGIAFNKPATYRVEGEMQYLLDDCDDQGKDLDQMIRDAVTENVSFGRGGILVDHTNANPDETRTLANAGRVILRMFEHDQIINWRISNGKLVLLVLRYVEEIDHDGFQHFGITRYIEYRMKAGGCYVRLWSDVNEIGLPAGVLSQPSEVSELKKVVAGGKHLDRIPFCWFGSLNNDPEMDPAPLADIANTNVAHYQADAAVSDSAFIAGQPTLFLLGVSQTFTKDNPNGVCLGGEQGVVLSNAGSMQTPDAKILAADPNTQSVMLMDKREKQLAMLGAKLIERNGGTKTATQAGNDAQTDNSILSQCVSNVEAAINQAFEFVKMYISGDGNVNINKVYEETNADPTVFTAYMNAVQTSMMRFSDFLAWQQKNGLIPNDEDIEDVEQELKNTTPPGMLATMEAQNNPGDGGDNQDDEKSTDDKSKPKAKKSAVKDDGKDS